MTDHIIEQDDDGDYVVDGTTLSAGPKSTTDYMRRMADRHRDLATKYDILADHLERAAEDAEVERLLTAFREAFHRVPPTPDYGATRAGIRAVLAAQREASKP